MPLDNPSPIHLAGRREWNERYGSYIEGARQWRMMSMIEAGVIVVLAWALVEQSSYSKVVPFVVEEDHIGESIAVHRVEPAPPPTALDIKAVLVHWICDVRQVSTDMMVEKEWGTMAFDHTDNQSQAATELEKWFRGNDPRGRSAKETVGVEVESVVQNGDELSYQVDFTEHHFTRDNNPPTTSFWRAYFRMKITPPKDEKTIIANPRGIYVTFFSITQRVNPAGEPK